jgi:hypothetical protein
MTRPAPRVLGWESVVLPPLRARRAAGLLAAGTIGFSTAVLGFPGAASAAPSNWSFSSADPNPIVVPAGTCAIDWTIIGSRGGADASDFPGPSPIGSKLRTAVRQGESFTLSVGAPGADAVDGGIGGTNPQGNGAYDGGDATADGSGGGGAASVVMRNGSFYLAGQGGLGQGAGGGEYGHAADPFPDEKLPPEPGDQTFVSLAQGENQGYISGEGVACGSFENPLVPTPGPPAVVPGPQQLSVWFQPFQPALPGAPTPSLPPGTTWEYSFDGTTWKPAGASTVYSPQGSSQRFTVTGLTDGRSYSLRLRATNASGFSQTMTGNAVTPFTLPGKPTGVGVEERPSALGVSWSAPTAAGTYPVDGYRVWVVRAGSTEDDPGPEWGCDTDGAGRSCVIPVPAGEKYAVYVQAVDDHDYTSDYQYVESGVVPLPEIPATVPDKDGDLRGASGAAIENVTAGKEVVIKGSGFAAFSSVRAIIYSTPTELKTFVTDENGEFEVTVTIPEDLPAGEHSLVVTGVDDQGNERTLLVDVTVSAAGTATVAGAALATTASSDRHPYTGFSVAGPLLGGTAAVALGAGLLVASRRRAKV